MSDSDFVQQIFCDGCGSGGALPAQLKYEYRRKQCDSCGHHNTNEFHYFFCGLNCLQKFVMLNSFNEDDNGRLRLPCRITWAHMLDNDGIGCPACGGMKVVD